MDASPCSTRLVVVDNASPDFDTQTFVRTHAPEAVCIARNRNDGFGRGCNRSAAEVSARAYFSQSRHVLPNEGVIGALWTFCNAIRRPASPSARVLRTGGCKNLSSLPRVVHAAHAAHTSRADTARRPLSRGFLMQDVHRDAVRPVDWVQGSAFMMDGDLFEIGFDDRSLYVLRGCRLVPHLLGSRPRRLLPSANFGLARLRAGIGQHGRHLPQHVPQQVGARACEQLAALYAQMGNQAPRMSPKVAIQCVAFWGEQARHDLDALFQSVTQLSYPKDKLFLVIVDNPSPHGTAVEYLMQRWGDNMALPRWEVVPSPVNDGYSGGHARGWAKSMESGADYIYLINQDAWLDPRAIEILVAYMEAHPNTAVAQSFVREAGSERINTCGNRLHYLGYGLRGTDPSDARPMFYASGAAVMMRPKMVKEIGGLFDPWNFMYHEDVDVSWRARLAGFDVALVPESVAYHRYEFERSMKLFSWMERNRLMTHLSNIRVATLILMAPMMLIMEAGGWWFALTGHRLHDKAATYRWFFQWETWRRIGQRRRVIRSLRQRTDREMLALMMDTLASEEVKSALLERVVNPVLRAYGWFLRWAVRW